MTDRPDRPNILMIMTDQQRGDCLGCDGHPVIETPHLDELASRGTRFRRAYTASPSCIPARASLLTGMNQWHTGILGMGRGQGPIPSNYAHTLPGELAAAGYHTQAIGKNHFHPYRTLNGYHNCILDESGRQPDSDYRVWFERNKQGAMGYRDHAVDWNSWVGRPTHLPEHLHPTHWTAQQALEWVERRDPTRPFFLKVSFARPHSPFDPPQVYYDMYRDRPMPEAAVGDWAFAPDPVNDPGASSTNAWRSRRSAAENQRARACYYGSITFIDHQVGRLLQQLQREHREVHDNTLVIFLSDHGEMLGDHHLWRKTYGFEGSARVPMIVAPPPKWRACPHNQVRDEVVELRDVMPTLLHAAGADVPATCDGASMLPFVTGRGDADAAPWRAHLHGEHVTCYSNEQASHYLTDGRHKYIYLPYLGHEMLFDLEADPMETRDLADTPAWADTLTQWRERLVDELSQRGSDDLLDGRKLRRLEPDEAWRSPHYGVYGTTADAEATVAR